MVMFVLALALLPLAMAGMAYQQPMMHYPEQNNWGNQQMGWQMNNNQQQQQHGNGQWWSMESQEEYEAYLKWCEERQMAIAEQEQQQALLKEMQMRAEQQQKNHEREKAAKEMQNKREAMVNQWRMWRSQLEMAEKFDGRLDEFTEMKVIYMFRLTVEFLQFCRCSDYASHLQQYLIHGKESYVPSVQENFAVDGFDTVSINDVDGTAQRVLGLSQAEGAKLLFGGAINFMCDGVKAYVEQIISWESQYNFMAK